MEGPEPMIIDARGDETGPEPMIIDAQGRGGETRNRNGNVIMEGGRKNKKSIKRRNKKKTNTKSKRKSLRRKSLKKKNKMRSKK